MLLKIFRGLLYGLPLALIFSYHPVIVLGVGENMNFELSVSLIWLFCFCLVSFIVMTHRRRFSLKKILVEKWAWLLFPTFVSLSLFWTENLLRGILTVGILWLIYFAVFSFFELRDLLGENFRRNFLRAFFAAGILVCLWCVLQCVLDLVGVSREISLMCRGCTTEMFGFPHPNGFAIEPQFMGNLLLAPAIVSGWLAINASRRFHAETTSHRPSLRGCSSRLAVVTAKRSALKPSPTLFVAIFFITTATLFLTFSRGAIYAFMVALIFFVVFEIVRTKKFRALALVAITGFSFLFTLNLQGIFAQVSGTNDTYFSGVAKVLNHLSLGIIDIPVSAGGNAEAAEEGIMLINNEAVFDGYVEESTTIRLELTEAAMRVWSRDFSTIMFGVGIGGAGEAMYLAGEMPTPKEIVQNEYASLLLEVGLIGILLFALTVVLIVRAILKYEKSGMVLTLIIAYAITLLFFSGLTNALQIYLMPAILLVVQMSLRKKFVS